MKLTIRQRMLSLLDSFDVYDEMGNTAFSVRSELSLTHHMKIYDNIGNEVGEISRELFHLFPTFRIYINGQCMGSIKKDFSLFIPKFTLDMFGWTVEGNILEWDYSIKDNMLTIMTVSKRIIALTDIYELDIYDDNNTVAGLLIALAIDAEKCSRN